MRKNMKAMKEWTVKAKWGNIAMVSWGDPANPPVLLSHGYMDSAATFILLVEQLPDTYYYVAFDLPGHGQSDPFPGGAVISLLHMVEVLRFVVDYMKWEKFAYISHSLGAIIGMFYNHSFPGRITKMVLIDPALSFFMHHLHNTPKFAYEYLYDLYYNFFQRWNEPNTKLLTMEEAVNLSHRTRTITEEQARIVIPRSLAPAGDGKFTLTLAPKMKRMASADVSEATLITILTQKAPPMLIVEASINICTPPGKDFAAKIIQKCLTVPNSLSVTVNGSHDVHITNPEGIAPYVVKFLKSDFDGRLVRGKL
uniref:AB hydrolase-1 domain-containing protein n=1 Tax=Heliothis virescens TaxID=7102 RepID=A0A2A4JCW5_HELVI